MFDRHVHTTLPTPAARSHASVWAALSLLASVGIAYWANYAARRDEHVQKALSCTALSSVLTTGASLMIEHVRGAEDKIRMPVPLDKNSNKFELPSLDAIFTGQETYFGLLDNDQQDASLRLEFLYREIRDDLANTPGLYHTGDTFGITIEGDKPFYLGVLNKIDEQAQATVKYLADGQHCASLAATRFLSAGPP